MPSATLKPTCALTECASLLQSKYAQHVIGSWQAATNKVGVCAWMLGYESITWVSPWNNIIWVKLSLVVGPEYMV